MDPVIFLWTLAATVFAGFHVFINKVLVQQKIDPNINGVFNFGMPACAGLAGVMWVGVSESWMMVVFFALCGGVVYGVGRSLSVESLRYIDSTIYFPINKILGPLFVVLSGVLLFGENLTSFHWFGIIGACLIPLLLISQTEQTRQHKLRYGLQLCVGATLLTGLSVLFVKSGVSFTSSLWLYLAVSNVFAAGVSFLIHIVQRRGATERFVVSRRDVLYGVGSGVLGTCSTITFFYAIQLGYISLVYTIHAHYILIPIVLSVWWYGEHIDARKMVAIALSCVTLLLLS
jgi:drug/metabolite transporter (DMT)-like permease